MILKHSRFETIKRAYLIITIAGSLFIYNNINYPQLCKLSFVHCTLAIGRSRPAQYPVRSVCPRPVSPGNTSFKNLEIIQTSRSNLGVFNIDF